MVPHLEDYNQNILNKPVRSYDGKNAKINTEIKCFDWHL